MLPLKDKVGTRSDLHTEVVTAARIQAFCNAVGVSDHSTAPATFLTVFRRGEFELLQTLGLELSNALHAEQQYDIIEPIRAGDEIEFQTEVSQILEKLTTKQSLQFLTLETRFHAKKGHTGPSPAHPSEGKKQLVGKSVSTLVFRHLMSHQEDKK